MSAAGVQRVRHALLVEVETDDGRIGIGEASTAGGPAISTQVVREHELKPLLVGEDPLLIERIWQKVFYRTRAHGQRGLVMNALSGPNREPPRASIHEPFEEKEWERVSER